MADAGKDANNSPSCSDISPVRILQGHVCRPGQTFLRQGTQVAQNNKVPSRIRQKSRLLHPCNSTCPYCFQVDMKKVNLQVIKPWIAKKVTELVGFEDEVVVEYAMGLLEDPNHTVSTTHS